jgi:transcriptional regulator with XRE-family HTH domain
MALSESEALDNPEAFDDPAAFEDPAAFDDGEMTLDLGRKISARRKAQKLTLVSLASLTGLSQPFLSQVERGRAQPSMSSLHRIARALGTVTPELMSSIIGESPATASHAEIDTDVISLVRANEGSATSHQGSQVKALVAGTRSMYPLEFHVATKEFEDYFQHAQPEFIYVISGTIEIDLDTENRHVLAQGDTLYFAGEVRHRWRAVGVWPARVLVTQANFPHHDHENIHGSNK